MRRVTLLTRAHCALCDEARALLEAEARRLSFSLRVVDVDAEPVLADEYGDWVPVAFAPDGAELFRLQVDAQALPRLLDAALDDR